MSTKNVEDNESDLTYFVMFFNVDLLKY